MKKERWCAMPLPSDTGPGAADFRFALGTPAIIKDEKSGLRKFSGVAYTGDPIVRHPYWGTVIFDLSMMKLPPKLPALRDHDNECIAGYASESTIGNEGLTVAGVLSSVTDDGKEVAGLSDEGFPWQMSVRIEPERIEEVLAGSTTIVNGRSVQGPCYIFRESTILEVSFTATGWDRGTHATAMSRFTQEEDTMSKELQDKLDAALGELKASRDENVVLSTKLSEMAALMETKTGEARMSRIKDAYAAADQEITDEKALEFSKLPDSAIDAIIGALEFSKPRLPDNLFSHQATGTGQGKQPEAKNAASELLALCDAKAQEFSNSRSK